MNDILTKEQIKIKKDKEALASLKSAKENMAIALNRISNLEATIANLASLIDSMMEFVPPASYAYRGEDTHREKFKKAKLSAMVGV